MRLAWPLAALPLLLSGCAAPTGAAEVDLHQVVRFSDGTSCSLRQLEVSAVPSDASKGAASTPGRTVTVSVEVTNPGPPIPASGVAMSFSYSTGGHAFQPRAQSGPVGTIGSAQTGDIREAFQVEDVPSLFRADHLQVTITVPGHPLVTFRGPVP